MAAVTHGAGADHDHLGLAAPFDRRFRGRAEGVASVPAATPAPAAVAFRKKPRRETRSVISFPLTFCPILAGWIPSDRVWRRRRDFN